MNTAKVAALTLCAILFLAAVAEAVEHRSEGRLSSSTTKASALKNWIKKRAEKFVTKLSTIASNLKLSLPWDNKGNLKGGKPLEQKATAEAAAALVTQLQKAPDDAFKPDASDLQSPNADDAQANALLEAADGMIDPDNPFNKDDPDDDINDAMIEATNSADSDSEDALMGFAGKALTRVDAGTVIADDPDLEQTPSDAELGSPEDDIGSFLEIRETRARLFHRNREGGSRRRRGNSEKATSQFIKILKGLKILLPQTFSAGVGGNLGPFAGSIDLAFDMNAETMGVVSCLSALLGTDSIGVGVNYHVQAGWYGKNQNNPPGKPAGTKPTLTGVWGGITAGVTGSVSFTAANVPLSIGAGIGWGANGITDAWKEFSDTITKAHTADKTLVQGSGSKAAISMKTLQSKAKDAWQAAKKLAKVATALLPNTDDTLVANIAVGTTASLSSLAVGADAIVGYCTVIEPENPTPMKLWKLILGLFLVSGPPGAVAGLFSWMAYHSDVVMEKLKQLKGKLVKIGKAMSTFAKVAANKIKNFWIARVLPATQDTIANFKGLVDTEKAVLVKGLQKMKTVYFFPTGNLLSNLVTGAKTKLKGFLNKFGFGKKF